MYSEATMAASRPTTPRVTQNAMMARRRYAAGNRRFDDSDLTPTVRPAERGPLARLGHDRSSLPRDLVGQDAGSQTTPINGDPVSTSRFCGAEQEHRR